MSKVVFQDIHVNFTFVGNLNGMLNQCGSFDFFDRDFSIILKSEDVLKKGLKKKGGSNNDGVSSSVSLKDKQKKVSVNSSKNFSKVDKKKFKNLNSGVPTIGFVKSVQDGIVRVTGLKSVQAGEMVLFEKSKLKGMALNLDKNEVGIVLFGNDRLIKQNDKVFGLNTTVKVNPKGVLGTVVDGIGEPAERAVKKAQFREFLLPEFSRKVSQLVEKKAPGIIARQSVCEPLYTGIKSIDLLFPIGRGQRELIIGDRQIGKTTIAIDAILSQKQVQHKYVTNLFLIYKWLNWWTTTSKELSGYSTKGKNWSRAVWSDLVFERVEKFLRETIVSFFFSEIVYCYYVGVGQKRSRVVFIKKALKDQGCLFYTTLVLAGASDPAPLQYIASYTGVALAEYWRDRGMHALIIYDDLSKQAVSYRQISLLLRRPPGREAFPGDVFYLHSRLLERAAKISSALGGGSLTALPIVETFDGDLSSYIPTNVISITDGQIFLEGRLFRQGVRPAVSLRLSVSRVGSAAQSKGLKDVIKTLKFEIAQYREIETFALFGSELEEDLVLLLERGQKISKLLNQAPNAPVEGFVQLFLIILIESAMFDELKLHDVSVFEKTFSDHVFNVRNSAWLLVSFKYIRAVLAEKAKKDSRAYLNLYLYEVLTSGQGSAIIVDNIVPVTKKNPAVGRLESNLFIGRFRFNIENKVVPTKLISFLDGMSSDYLWLNLVLIHFILKEIAEGVSFKLSVKDKMLVKTFFNVYIGNFILCKN